MLLSIAIAACMLEVTTAIHAGGMLLALQAITTRITLISLISM